MREEFGKKLPQLPLAETWECSTHPDGPSMIASGVFAGRTLDGVLEEHPEWLGSHAGSLMPGSRDSNGKLNPAGLPILIKLIDAHADLSVQVHPGDSYALKHEGELGKTEMWYVLDALPGSVLIYGFAHEMDERKVRDSIAGGELMTHLQSVPVHRGDVFFIRPGTIHAIGGGVLLAEIQESSNVTYRVYDYDRRDKDGRLRQLHVEKALQVLNYREEPAVRQKMRVMRYQPGAAREMLCRCKYFQVERLLLSAGWDFRVEENSFQALLALEGSLTVSGLDVKKGDCVFIPAASGQVSVRGKGELLRIGC